MKIKVKNTTFEIKNCDSKALNVKQELYKKIIDLKKKITKKPEIIKLETIDDFLNFSTFSYEKNKEKIFGNLFEKRD